MSDSPGEGKTLHGGSVGPGEASDTSVEVTREYARAVVCDPSDVEAWQGSSQLPPDSYDDSVKLDPDYVLTQQVGKFAQVVVIGFDPDAGVHVACSHGSRDALWLMKRGEHFLLFESE